MVQPIVTFYELFYNVLLTATVTTRVCSEREEEDFTCVYSLQNIPSDYTRKWLACLLNCVHFKDAPK